MRLLLLISTYLLIPNAYTQENFNQQKIQFLLNEIENSKLIFVRNEKEHSSKEARTHLEYKMSMAKKAFWFFGPERKITVSEFINKIASQSSSSGKPYQIKYKNGKLITTKKWLKQKLLNFKKK